MNTTDGNTEHPTDIGTFDLLSSEPHVKALGVQRFSSHLDEFASSNMPTSDLLLGIHEAISPDVTAETLPAEARAEMRLALLILDRPDREHVTSLSEQMHNEEAAKKVHTSWKGYYLSVRERLADELSKTTRITVAPKPTGALRSLGSRQIDGYPEESVVYASHTLTMAGMGQMMAFQMGANQMIMPDSYYGLSAGLDEVYKHLCDTYDHMKSKSSDLTDVLAKEAFLQVLGTRLIHPFWDGNGRGFMGHLAVTLKKEGHVPDMDKLKTASILLGDTGDNLVLKVLEESQLGLVSDVSSQQPLHYLMWVAPEMRLDYMNRLRGGLTSAIDTITDPASPYYRFLEETHSTLVHVLSEK